MEEIWCRYTKYWGDVGQQTRVEWNFIQNPVEILNSPAPPAAFMITVVLTMSSLFVNGKTLNVLLTCRCLNLYYRPQTKSKVMFLQVSVILSTGGACVVAWGGVRGYSWGCAWLLWGGMHGCSPGGHAWLLWGGMCGCSRGACVVAPGGRAWFFQWDTVNERAVHILLECILVSQGGFYIHFSQLFCQFSH